MTSGIFESGTVLGTPSSLVRGPPPLVSEAWIDLKPYGMRGNDASDTYLVLDLLFWLLIFTITLR